MGALVEALEPADIEALGTVFLTPQMGYPVGTKVRAPARNQTKPDPFVRVEFGGGTQVNRREFDGDLIICGYAVDEVTASAMTRRAFGLAAAATGETVDGWFLGWCRGTVLPHRLPDPQVPSLVRYRSMVTWRFPGQLIQPLTP